MEQKTMKALCYMGSADLQLRERPVPVCGDDDIIIEVKGAGICGADMHWKSGAFTSPNAAFILGHEFAGVIVEKGKYVDDYWQVGNRVVSDNTGAACGRCYPCITGEQVHCAHRESLGSGLDGGFAKYCKIPGAALKGYSSSLMKLPDSISFEEGAIMEPAANAYKAVVQDAGVIPGDTVVVFGLGPIGLLVIQMAKAAGASTIIACGMKKDRDIRLPLAEKYGTTDFYGSDECDVPAEILKKYGDDAVRVVIDCAGASSIMNGAMRYLCHDGKFIRVGNMPADYNYSLIPLIDKQITVVGHMGYNALSWRNTLRLVENGQVDLKSLVSRRMALEEHEEAYELMRTKQVAKIVLVPEL